MSLILNPYMFVTAGGGGLAFAGKATATNTSSNATNYTSNALTVSGGANRLLLSIATIAKDASATVLNTSITSVNFNNGGATAATAIHGDTSAAHSRGIACAWLVAPASGSTTVTWTFGFTARAIGLSLWEFTGVDQATPVPTGPTFNTGTSDTSKSQSLTLANANGIMAGALCLWSNGNSDTVAVATDLTQEEANLTGTAAADVAWNHGWKAHATSGSKTADWTWGGANRAWASFLMELKAA